MFTQRLGRMHLRFWVAVGILLLPTCKGVDLTAPTGSSISISANPSQISLNGGESTITVILTNPDGSPVPDGTAVYLTATLGTIADRAETRGSRLTETLVAGNEPGTATVTARSGTSEVSAETEVTIGTSLTSIAVSANPASLGPDGGKATVTAVAYGANFETLANVPITFSTDAGSLESEGEPIRTNSQGEARDTLTTTTSANVTATSGDLSATATVEVGANTPPTAQFSHSPTSPKVGEVVNFSAAESTDADGKITNYQWDFGDGATGSGIRASHVYQSANSFTAVLVVTDDLGATGSKTSTVRVSLGDAPIASFTFNPSAPELGGTGTVTVTFDASSSRDPDGRIVEYTWDWGDGTSPVITGEGDPTAQHQFTAADTYTVKLTVRDDLNNITTTQQQVTVK
jgi:PKD repeat protein